MLNDKIQNQEGGDGSTNLQGQVVNIYNGITYKDAKEIALDVFHSNFLQLKHDAAQIARQRAEEITDTFLEELKRISPDAIQEFQQPAMQDALFTVQKAYAKSGDKELGDLLVDVLIDRANTPKRTLMQVVLDEALLIAPKLIVEQLDTLTLSFLLIQTQRFKIKSLESFDEYIKTYIVPFIDNLTDVKSLYSHIEYLGCGHKRAGDYGNPEDNFLTAYKVIFQTGFTIEEFEATIGPIENYKNFLMPCLHDSHKLQLNKLDDVALEQSMTESGLSADVKQKFNSLFNKSTMHPLEVRKYILGIDNRMTKLFDVWQNSPFKNMELTSVGIAMAHANYRCKTGQTFDLSIWIK